MCCGCVSDVDYILYWNLEVTAYHITPRASAKKMAPGRLEHSKTPTPFKDRVCFGGGGQRYKLLW